MVNAGVIMAIPLCLWLVALNIDGHTIDVQRDPRQPTPSVPYP